MNEERRRLVALYENRVRARLQDGEAELRDLRRGVPYREETALDTALRRLVRRGEVERRVVESYESVSVRWGFGGATACKRRRAKYRLAKRVEVECGGEEARAGAEGRNHGAEEDHE